MGMMATHSNNRLLEPEYQELRRAGGAWLREIRERCGLSQRDLASLLNLEYYTFISAIENGRGRIPPDRYVDWADALGVPAKDFVRQLLKYYDPVTHDILFPSKLTDALGA